MKIFKVKRRGRVKFYAKTSSLGPLLYAAYRYGGVRDDLPGHTVYFY